MSHGNSAVFPLSTVTFSYFTTKKFNLPNWWICFPSYWNDQTFPCRFGDWLQIRKIDGRRRNEFLRESDDSISTSFNMYTFLNETAMRKESAENEFIERKWLIVIMGNDVIFLKTKVLVHHYEGMSLWKEFYISFPSPLSWRLKTYIDFKPIVVTVFEQLLVINCLRKQLLKINKTTNDRNGTVRFHQKNVLIRSIN